MRRLIIAGSIALVVALAVLYTAGWRYARARMVEEVGAQMEALRADGYRVDWTDTTTGGFPFRVDVSLAAPAIASPPGPSAWSWSADALVFSVTPRDPTSVEIAPAGLQSVRPPQGELLAVASEDARVRVSTQSGEITRVAADARSLVISEAVNGRIIARATSGRAVLAREAGTDPAHNAVLTARGFEWAARPGGAPA
ncbi:MAG: DUF2125 domain-containing protein, partial [Caulobacterales bacterium]|nr:DUF2125 domain-containing protein [Caulobacterales bacterium]